MNTRKDIRGSRRIHFQWLPLRRVAVFFLTFSLTLAAGWRLLPVLAPGAQTQAYRVRAKVELPTGSGLPEADNEIRNELIRPAAIEDALAAAGIQSGNNDRGSASSVSEQLEVETRVGSSTFDLLIGLPQISKIDSEAAAVIVNRLVEAWLAGHRQARLDQADRKYAILKTQLDQVQRQMSAAASQCDALMNQLAGSSGPALAPGAGQNVADQAALKRKSNLQRHVAELRAHRTELLETRTAEHPDVIAANEELSLLESRLRELNSEGAAAEPAAIISTSTREELNVARRRFDGARAQYDRLAVSERAAFDELQKSRAGYSSVWFPATGIVAKPVSSLLAWEVALAASALLLALLAAMLTPQPSLVLRTASDAERVIGAPVVGVISARSVSAAA